MIFEGGGLYFDLKSRAAREIRRWRREGKTDVKK